VSRKTYAEHVRDQGDALSVRLAALERVAVVARLVAKYDFPHDINRLRAALAALDAQEPKP
jgi:hypothetical protein